MSWTEKDLQNLKEKGLKVDGIKSIEIKTKKPKQKIAKISIEKKAIELWLEIYKRNGLITNYVAEYRFHSVRRFRFDWAIVDLKIAIEYEGVFSKKSRHTTVTGYSNDIEKYNLALTQGWKVLRYTAKNHKNFESDLYKLLNVGDLENKKEYCRLYTNGALDEKCDKQCDNCLKASADQLLQQNFIIETK